MLDSVQSQQLKLSKGLDSMFQGYAGVPFAIRLWDGWRWTSSANGAPVCTLVVNSTDALRALLSRPSEITLGEAFLSKDIDVEGDLFSVFAVTEYLFRCPQSRRQRLLEVIADIFFGLNQWWTQGRRHSIERDRSSISYHYDQPIDFYRPWLGESLAYSCAYFQTGDDSLDVAQESKLELICKKLRLCPDDRFLDIGCGWGSLVLHAASKHNVYAQGITISHEQAAVAAARIESMHLTQSCSVRLLDYREAPGRLLPFDKIASLGMFEHVGSRNLPRYFRSVHQLLKPGGVFLNHGIARTLGTQDRDTWLPISSIRSFLQKLPLVRRAQSSAFIEKYVFPEGELVPISEALRAAESAGFEVRDVENLREHYELTLRRWVDGLQKNVKVLLNNVPEYTYRIWLLYMAGSAAAFRRGDIAVYQMLLSRPDRGDSKLPLTRADWYRPDTKNICND